MNLLLTLPAFFVLAAPAAYTPQQLALAREITELALSPDGCRVAFAADLSGAQEVWLVPACRSNPPVLRAEPAWPEQLSNLGEQASELAFSPDGRSVLFASDRGGDERRDLYLVPAGGGPIVPLTMTPASETDPDADHGASFSPDGRRLAYVADQPMARSTATAAAPTGGAAAPTGGAAAPNAEAGFGFQLFVMDLDTRQTRRVTREPVSLRRPVWSPDGRAVALTRSADGERGDLLFVDLESGATRSLEAPVPEGIVIAEQWMPDGATVLCRATNGKGFLQLALAPAKGGALRFLGPDDWDVDEARARAGAGIVFSLNEDGRSALYRLASPGAKPLRLFGPAGRISGFDLDRSGRRLAMLWGDSRRPTDVWMLDLKTGRPTAMTRSLAGGVDPEFLKPAEQIEYPSADGVVIHALYTPPAHAGLGGPPPIVVIPHGGPDMQSFDEFHDKWQALSQAGFAVLAPNYRGSTGYGKAFLDLNNKDWGGKDLEDLRAGVRFLAGKGLADPRRAGITGDSYGGYLTLMSLARMPESWAAGVDAYGMPDLRLDFESTGDRFVEWYKTEMGTPATDAALFKERSAITYIDAIRAPLLIFQGANDTNVPPAESELIYNMLLERRVPVGLVVYPDEGHGFTKRRNRMDFLKRTVDFFLAQLAQRKPDREEP